MKLGDTVAFVTGSSRGLGLALIEDLLARGARRVYAGIRDERSAAAVRALDPRIVAVRLDVTDAAQVSAAAAAAADTRLLINNAGVLASYSVLDAAEDLLRRDLEVNYLGVLNVVRSFAAALVASGDAAIVNVLTVASMASMPAIGGYAASKAAAWSLTQALRAELAPRGVRVHAAFPGPIDTDMIRAFDLPKTSAAAVARAILDGVEAGTTDIAPDPMSTEVLSIWRADPFAIERRFAG